MELLAELFESDLRYFSIATVILSALFPWRLGKQEATAILTCLAVYILAELTVSVLTTNFLITILSLFLGSLALSAAVGRILKIIWINFKKR